MLVVMAISLYTSRIVLKNLGISDYGLYNVVGSIAAMFTFLNTAMNSSTQRYLSLAVGRNDAQQLHKIFNVSFVIHALIGIVIILACEVFGTWFINHKMVIPEGREMAVFWTFQLSLLAAFLSIIMVPYDALVISRERMSTFAYISIFDVFFKLFVAFIISVVSFDRLVFYSLLIVLSQFVVALIYSSYCKRHFEECSFKFYRFDSLYKEMTVFASWGLLGHISYIINTAAQNMMLNVFFSPVINAARGVALSVSNAVGNFSFNFQTAVSPQITKSYAVGDNDRLFALIYNSSRFSLYLLWLFSLPIMLCMKEILDLWLVEVPDYTMVFLGLVLIFNLIESGANPLNMAIRAKGKIKYPELIGGIILIMNFPLSYLALSLGYGPQSVFVIMIICGMVCQINRIYFANKYLQMSISDYLIKVITHPLLVLAVSAIIPILFSLNCHIEPSILYVLSVSIISILSILVTVYCIGLSKVEKVYMVNTIKNRLQR
jgi:O-antigen/teichoic acid export membrane protein